MELVTVYIHGILGWMERGGVRGMELVTVYPWDTGMDDLKGREGDGVGYCLYPWILGWMDGRS